MTKIKKWLRKLFGTKKLVPEGIDVDTQYRNRPRKWIYTLALVIVVLVLVFYSLFTLGIDLKDRDILSLLKQLVNGLIHPNMDFLLGRGEYEGIGGVPYLTLQTIAIAFVGTIVSSILAIPFGFLTAKNVVGKRVSKVGEVLLIIIRTFPEILLALVLIRVTGIGAFTGTLAIGIHSVGMIGKLYAESIENMEPGPIEALDAVGANSITKIRYGIFPQVLPEFISTVLYRFDINVRTATVLGVVSAGGLGAPMIFAIAGYHWSDLGAILIAIIVMVVSVDLLSSFLRKKLI